MIEVSIPTRIGSGTYDYVWRNWSIAKQGYWQLAKFDQLEIPITIGSP